MRRQNLGWRRLVAIRKAAFEPATFLLNPIRSPVIYQERCVFVPSRGRQSLPSFIKMIAKRNVFLREAVQAITVPARAVRNRCDDNSLANDRISINFHFFESE